MNRINRETPAPQIRILLLLGCGLVLAGCNTRPDTPKTTWYGKHIKIVQVDPAAGEEIDTVTAVEVARVRYHNALARLQTYYDTIGMVQKHRWAARELKNLDEAQEFTWSGINPPPPPPEQKPSKETSERNLVENVVLARGEYIQAVDNLAQLYEKKNLEFKAYVVHTMQARFHTDETYLYLLRVTLPPKNLEPVEISPQANKLYDRAMELYRQGSTLPAMADYPKQRRALALLSRLIRQYPRSTRIALAAFYIAEIYKEYFREHYLAVQWYELARTWDPNIPRPVRFQEAVQYDFNLGQKPKALELYKACIKLEPFFTDNVRYATQRIEELNTMLENSPQPDTNAPK